jgi:hypothetical protein
LSLKAPKNWVKKNGPKRREANNENNPFCIFSPLVLFGFEFNVQSLKNAILIVRFWKALPAPLSMNAGTTFAVM